VKSEIAMVNKFRPVKLEIIFESNFEFGDFIARLKADNHLPNPTEGLIRQLEAFQDALVLSEKPVPIFMPDECIPGNIPCPECRQPLWGIPNKPMPLHCQNTICPQYRKPAK